ncbi:MAG: IS630 family transposase [Acidobacteria bacterium]|nr:IS630 family transposase [Acidobacteriota bacterium]
MSRKAAEVILTSEERRVLTSWVRGSSTEQRLALRGRIILAAQRGESSEGIARRERVRRATVSKWRGRFARQRLAGLQDAPRPGARPRYGPGTEQRVLRQLDEAPPKGYARWNGRRLAKTLSDVSPRQVWRILKRRGLHLERRHSWCVSTDPEFARKAADIVGIYLHPPENAVLLSVDEKPHIQALERAQGYLRLPNGRALRGFSHDYKRHGTTTLFAALNVLTGRVEAARHSRRRRRRNFLAFLNDLIARYGSERPLHVILDNLNIHKPKHDRWRAQHPWVHFHFTPTHASWLNQIECWFSILSRQALQGSSFTSPQQLRQQIDQFMATYNTNAEPFEWTKHAVHNTSLKRYYSDLCH